MHNKQSISEYTFNQSGLFGRFSAWNTARDGSGTYYRGGQILTDSDPANINLYEQWTSVFQLLDGANAFASQKPQVFIEGTYNHQTEATAYDVDQSQALHYRASLDFTQNRKTLSTLWGRIDKVTDYHGFLKAKFDSRFKFNKTVDVVFASTWLKPDEAALQQDSLQAVKVSQEDYNAIAVSDDPYLRVGGEIDMHINGTTQDGYTKFDNANSSANWQVARLFPTGKLDVALRDIDTNKEITTSNSPISGTRRSTKTSGIYRASGAAVDSNGTVLEDGTSSSLWQSQGRSYNPLLAQANPDAQDTANYSDAWSVTPPSIPGLCTFRQCLTPKQ